MRFTTLSPDQDRALHEWRQGRPVVLDTHSGTHLCWAVDTATDLRLEPGGTLLLSAARAASLGLPEQDTCLAIDAAGDPGQLRFLMQARTETALTPHPAPAFAPALIALAKQGRLIPAFYLHPAPAEPRTWLRLGEEALTPSEAPAALQRQSTVPLPIKIGAQVIETQALLFAGGPLHEEAVALQVGDPHSLEAPLVRLHSACLTGDVFGSLRCDCGPQLHGALQAMAEEGQGCLLYLPQEGRDTGLSNKLRAYALQDAGLDTIDADATLGFEADERDFAFAAAMLRQQGLERIRLLTNNPKKVATLRKVGIDVTERVPLKIPPHPHNQSYLDTKAQRAGHLL